MILGFMIIIGFCVYCSFFFIRDILIGAKKLRNPMYDTDAKTKYALKRGIVGLCICSIAILFFGINLLLCVIS